jgi:hypothetical protein
MLQVGATGINQPTNHHSAELILIFKTVVMMQLAARVLFYGLLEYPQLSSD